MINAITLEAVVAITLEAVVMHILLHLPTASGIAILLHLATALCEAGAIA
jgi:hypothetical protein